MNVSSKKIAYVLPSFILSGGMAVVLEHAQRLQQKGYEVSLIVLSGEKKVDWFPLSVVPVFNVEEAQSLLLTLDIIIGTHFSTIPFIQEASVPRKIYFVQSDERRFEMDNFSSFFACHQTYRVPMEHMTEARWIQRWLKEEFGHQAYYVPNGLNTDLFHPTQPRIPKGKRLRVLIEGSINSPFKRVQAAYDAVKDLDCEIWFVSGHGKPQSGWRYDQFFEHLPIDQMKGVYSSCDILLKLSDVEGFFGPPLEAMACGCAVVVGEVTGFDEYIKDGYNALVVSQSHVGEAREAVKKLIEDTRLRDHLVHGGYATATEWSWERSVEYLEVVIRKDPVTVFYTSDSPRVYDFRQIRSVFLQPALGKISDLRSRIEGLQCNIEDLEKEKHHLRKASSDVQQVLEHITSSRGWRIISFLHNVRMRIPLLRDL